MFTYALLTYLGPKTPGTPSNSKLMFPVTRDYVQLDMNQYIYFLKVLVMYFINAVSELYGGDMA